MTKKFILFEINKGVTLTHHEWIPDGNDVYKITYTNSESTSTFSYGFGNWGYHSYGSSGTEITPAKLTNREPLVKVGSLIFDSTEFSNYSTLDDILQHDNSFYFDLNTQILYVHFSSTTSPFSYSTTTIGVLNRFSNFSGWYDGLYYEGRINSVSNISITQDNQYFGILNYNSNSVTMNNIDGFFDNIDEEDIFGQRCKLYFSEDLDFTNSVVYSGFLESFSISTNEIKINIRDIRKSLEISIPENVFLSSDFPNIGNSENKPIPLAYGILKDVPAQLLDDTDGLSIYSFKICDTTYHSIKSIDKVFVDGEEKTPSNVDLLNATFTLSSINFKTNQKVTVDIQGYVDNTNTLIENPLSIIKDLIVNSTDYEYLPIFFDTNTWDSIEGSDLPPCSIYISSSTLISEINKLSMSIFGLFIITQEGKFSYIIQDLNKPSSKTIKYYQLLSEPENDYLSSSYLSSSKVGYLKRYNSSDYNYVINNSIETLLKNKYRNKVQIEFLTQLVDKDDAIIYAQKTVDQFGGIFSNYSFDVSITTDIKLMDIILVELFEVATGVYAFGKLIVNSVSNNYNNFITTVKGKLLEIEMPSYSLRDLISLKGNITYTQDNIIMIDNQLKRKL
jgi:hypothetical protein